MRPSIMKRALSGVLVAVFCAGIDAQRQDVDAFFDGVLLDILRTNPNAAITNRYLPADEQRQLEREVTRLDDASYQQRIVRAREALAGLARFDRASMSDAQRVSADVFAFQMQTLVDSAPYHDYVSPLEQFRGANVTLVDALTVQHPLQTAAPT
jgi:uncharacterized protein (DUF885 family)